METTKIQHKGYGFEGDKEGLEYIQSLNDSELQSIIGMLKYMSNLQFYCPDGKGNHLRVTDLGSYTYKAEKV